MKIVFTGGGSGGHFYPIIAVAEELRDLVAKAHRRDPELYFISPTPYDAHALFANDISFIASNAGKIRRYKALANVTDFFVTLFGTISTFFILLKIVPDVVFSKGGYGSVPTILAASLLRIPIVIHESDSRPGRANLLAARFAKRIAITYPSSLTFFPSKYRDKIAITGIPVRRSLQHTQNRESSKPLGLEKGIPTILVLGGSAGSAKINEVILDALPQLTSFANVIHQTGKDNFEEVKNLSTHISKKNEHSERYYPFSYLTKESLSQALHASDLVLSRAGSTSITEISLWSKPAILIPIPEQVSHDQKTNAYEYARLGGAVVIEEQNLSAHILTSEVRRITSSREVSNSMSEKGSVFANPHAANIIATELFTIASSHAGNEA